MQGDFSVLMSVYHKENSSNIVSSLDSIINQSLRPSEIVLVKDGPISIELEKVIEDYDRRYPQYFKIISLPKNKGLGNALRIGIQHCTHELVARMDTDDICVLNRFEEQIKILFERPEIDVIGCNIEEFNTLPGDLKRVKINPRFHNDLVKKIKFKSPFNHPTIMFKKSVIIKAGGYNDDLMLFEDYSLFIRLWLSGAIFYNIQEVLLFFRVGSGIETIKRRSGLHYLKKEWDFINFAKRIGAFNSLDCIKYMALKFPIRLFPPKIVLFVYNRFLRKQQND